LSRAARDAAGEVTKAAWHATKANAAAEFSLAVASSSLVDD